MEQKKILWIITASGIFLTVVFLFALIVVRTKTSNVPSRAQMPAIEKPMATPVPQKTDDSLTADSVAISKEDIENLSEASESEDTLADAGESVNPIIKNDDGTVTIDLNQVNGSTTVSAVIPRNDATAAAMENKKQSEKVDTIYTVAPSSKTAAEVEAEKQAAVLNAAGAKPQTVTSAGTSKTQTTVTPAAKSSVAAATAVNVKPASVETTKYWVQCAAYTSKKTADQARSKLDENRIPAEVFTYQDAKKNLFYRVRVGPYTTKSEAEYWKNRISQIDLFKTAQSYITMN